MHCLAKMLNEKRYSKIILIRQHEFLQISFKHFMRLVLSKDCEHVVLNFLRSSPSWSWSAMSSTPRIDRWISATRRKFRSRILFRFRCFCYHRAHQSRHFPGSTSGVGFIFQNEWKLILWSKLTGWWRSRCKRRRFKHPSLETAFRWHACAWDYDAENGNSTDHERYFCEFL